METYLADDFVQHAGRIPQGKQGSIDYLASRSEARAKDRRTSHFARVIADGDLVLVHRLVTSDSDPRGTVFADLYRVRNGQVTEHWDVVQPVPEFSVSGRSMTGGPDDPLEPGRTIGGPKEH
jgi:predicted SnoaL-like aldol condensation-catalyzing enzyme